MRIPSVASQEFWRAYRRLPRDVRKAATRAYRIWQQDAFHPSLHFKKVGGRSLVGPRRYSPQGSRHLSRRPARVELDRHPR